MESVKGGEKQIRQGKRPKRDAFSGQVQSGPDGVWGRATPAALVTLRMVPAQVRSLRLLVSISPWTPPGAWGAQPSKGQF